MYVPMHVQLNTEIIFKNEPSIQAEVAIVEGACSIHVYDV